MSTRKGKQRSITHMQAEFQIQDKILPSKIQSCVGKQTLISARARVQQGSWPACCARLDPSTPHLKTRLYDNKAVFILSKDGWLGILKPTDLII